VGREVCPTDGRKDHVELCSGGPRCTAPPGVRSFAHAAAAACAMREGARVDASSEGASYLRRICDD
jgi:hypothetical protein